MEFNLHQDMPRNSKVTYVRLVCDIQPNKTDTSWSRITAVVSIVDHTGEVDTPIAYLTTVKIHVSSAIYDIILHFMFMDVKDSYLKHCMNRATYITIHTSMIPEDFMITYNLKYRVNKGYTFSRVSKDIYRLPQAVTIAHDDLVQHLTPYGYHPTKSNPGLWTYDTCPITFTLAINGFGVKYART